MAQLDFKSFLQKASFSLSLMPYITLFPVDLVTFTEEILYGNLYLFAVQP